MKVLIAIDIKNVDIVAEYKYLGCTIYIQDDLKWDSHVSTPKKANNRKYLVGTLRKLNVSSKIQSILYNSIMSSVANYVVSSLYNACTGQQNLMISKWKERRVT